MQARYATFADLWDRGLRAREEGRPGPFNWVREQQPAGAKPGAPAMPHVVHVSSMGHMERRGSGPRNFSAARLYCATGGRR